MKPGTFTHTNCGFAVVGLGRLRARRPGPGSDRQDQAQQEPESAERGCAPEG